MFHHVCCCDEKNKTVTIRWMACVIKNVCKVFSDNMKNQNFKLGMYDVNDISLRRVWADSGFCHNEGQLSVLFDDFYTMCFANGREIDKSSMTCFCSYASNKFDFMPNYALVKIRHYRFLYHALVKLGHWQLDKARMLQLSEAPARPELQLGDQFHLIITHLICNFVRDSENNDTPQVKPPDLVSGGFEIGNHYVRLFFHVLLRILESDPLIREWEWPTTHLPALFEYSCYVKHFHELQGFRAMIYAMHQHVDWFTWQTVSICIYKASTTNERNYWLVPHLAEMVPTLLDNAKRELNEHYRRDLIYHQRLKSSLILSLTRLLVAFLNKYIHDEPDFTLSMQTMMEEIFTTMKTNCITVEDHIMGHAPLELLKASEHNSTILDLEKKNNRVELTHPGRWLYEDRSANTGINSPQQNEVFYVDELFHDVTLGFFITEDTNNNWGDQLFTSVLINLLKKLATTEQLSAQSKEYLKSWTTNSLDDVFEMHNYTQ